MKTLKAFLSEAKGDKDYKKFSAVMDKHGFEKSDWKKHPFEGFVNEKPNTLKDYHLGQHLEDMGYKKEYGAQDDNWSHRYEKMIKHTKQATTHHVLRFNTHPDDSVKHIESYVHDYD